MESSTFFHGVPNMGEYDDEACPDLDFFNEYTTGDSGYYSTFSGPDIVDSFDYGAADIQNASNESSSSNPNLFYSVDKLHASKALHLIEAVGPATLESKSFEGVEHEAVENTRLQSIHPAVHIPSLRPEIQPMQPSASGAMEFNLSPESLDMERFFSLDDGLSTINPTGVQVVQDLFSQKELAMVSTFNDPNFQEGSELAKPVLEEAVKWMTRQSSKCTRNSRSIPTTRGSNGKYKCTVGCGQSFCRVDVWKKHEAEQIPREGWICCVPDSFWVEGRKICTYCGVQDPDSDHHATAKHPIPCEHRPMGRGRTFFRKEHLKNHLQKVHPAIRWHNFLDRGHFEFEPQFPRACSLCQSYWFSSFSDRTDHLISHFESDTNLNDEQAVDSEPALDVRVGMETGLAQLRTINSDAESIFGRRHHFTEGSAAQQMSLDDHQKPEPRPCQISNRVGKVSVEEPSTFNEVSRTEVLGRIRSSRASSKKLGYVFEAAKRKLHEWTFAPFIGGAQLVRELFRKYPRLQSPLSTMLFLSSSTSLFPRQVQVRREKAVKLLLSIRDRAPMRSPLASVLLAAREFSAAPKRSYFIPTDSIDRCLTKDAITAEIVRLGIDTSVSVEETADCVFKKYRKIFGILTMMNKGGEIEKFLFHHASDLQLPLRIPESAEIRRPLQPELAIFESWSDSDIRSFSSTQWSFLAPFFSLGTSSKISHYNLDPETVFPFLEDKDLAEPRSGGFSTVFKVLIHPDHHNFDFRHGNNTSFAIKHLKSSNDSDFEREKSSLRLFSHDFAHDHIIKLLASYTLRSQNYLLFQWADKDLRRYWEDSEQPPKLTIVMMEWSLRQMRGLVSGLDAIHNCPIPMVDQVESTIRLAPSRKGSSVRWHHGDIKPENILWFSDGSMDDMGVLKLSDFGTANFRTSSSQGGITTPACGTLTYEPPDRWLGSETSQSYDIWSLGCVFSEFITWMLMGSEGGDLFRDARMESGTAIDKFGGLGTENFFTLDRGTSEVPMSARLKDGVRLWLADLRGHPNCSYALRDLLLVIESELLVPEAQKRATSGTLLRLLDQIIQKGAASEQYRVADTALQLRPPTSKKRDFSSTNLKTWSPDMKRARLDLMKCNWSLPLPRSPSEDEEHEHHF